jgi:hypothetical protein
MKTILCTWLLLFIAVSVYGQQDSVDEQIRGANQGLLKCLSTRSVSDLYSSMRLLMMITLPNDKAHETHLESVTDMWIEFFKAVDNAYYPTFDPEQKFLMNNEARNANDSETAEEIANRELLRKANDYWSLKTMDDIATAAVKTFFHYHYYTPQDVEQLA